MLPLCCLISLFYIKPQLDARLKSTGLGCLISLFYIKPQQSFVWYCWRWVVLYLYSTSNHNWPLSRLQVIRVVLYLYSTSNHNYACIINNTHIVVLYLYSTSNHNFCYYVCDLNGVVLYLYSTSNHNIEVECDHWKKLSYIFILHQTTTQYNAASPLNLLSYIFILHQTTTRCKQVSNLQGCLIYLFYIKPQLRKQPPNWPARCLIYLFYIKPQLAVCCWIRATCCLIYLFYIKPQLHVHSKITQDVVLYIYSTSNHNYETDCYHLIQLSYIFILHQTTTSKSTSSFLSGCLIYLFYIKPQLHSRLGRRLIVVLYIYSTSNHNSIAVILYRGRVVLYIYSTSNHNSYNHQLR